MTEPFPDLPAEDRALLAAAREAALAGADVHRDAAGRAGRAGWSEKGRSDFVTEVDLEAERRIAGVLGAAFPEHPILAEEGTDEAGRTGRDGSGLRWIVDPLDGTTNWLHGYPEHAVSIAAEDARGLRVGVVVNSATGEVYEAARGAGSRRNGAPIRVSGATDLRLALVGTGFPFKKADLVAPYLATFERVLAGTSGIRRAGAAALDLCALACGRLDAFWELWLMPWDVAAGALIVREAGGVFEPLDVPPGAAADGWELRPGAFIAANGSLLAGLRGLVGS
ncbi:MAG: inositol monophosphatase family protein [Gemmatimonadota bacterium]